jgi:hypothetical protein
MHKYLIVIHYILQDQTMDAIILQKKVRYLDPVAICEARHAGPKWMKDDDDFLKPFATKKEKQKE